jgi:MFS family permease
LKPQQRIKSVLVYYKKPEIFYGYIVTAASFLIMTTAWGANRSFGAFLAPMLNEFGWTRAGISGAFTLAMLTIGAMSLVAGKLTDMFGPRTVVMICGLFLGLGFILVSQARSILQFYIFYGAMTGIGLSGCLVPLLSSVARWFAKKRALISGILMAGPALGIVMIPPLASILISAYGWRQSYLILGFAVLVIVIFLAMFLKRDPGNTELSIDDREKSSIAKSDAPIEEYNLFEAARTRQFWLLNFISFGDLFLINVIVVHIVIYAASLGISNTAAAGVLSVAAGISIPARIIMGGVADRIGNREALMVCLFMSIVAFILLLIAKELWLLYLFAAIYGFGLWATGPMMPPITAELFGLRSHGTILAFVLLAHNLGGAVGPVLVGHIFDVTHSYHLGFLLCLGISVTGFTAITLFRPLTKRDGRGVKTTLV